MACPEVTPTVERAAKQHSSPTYVKSSGYVTRISGPGGGGCGGREQECIRKVSGIVFKNSSQQQAWLPYAFV